MFATTSERGQYVAYPLITYFIGGSNMLSVALDHYMISYTHRCDNMHPVCVAPAQCRELVPALVMR